MQMMAAAQMLCSLAAVVLLIFACAWLAKRMPMAGAGRSNLLQVKASLSVGARERVVLVKAGDKVLVLGVAPGRINTLHVLDEQAIASNNFAELMASEENA
ncbi:MAG: flagellar biosynthetic protein FliO [Oceanococcus sp.]